MENSTENVISPVYGFSNRAANTGRLNRINTVYDRSLEQIPLDQYELEESIARTQPDVEKNKHTWLSDAYTSFMNKKDEITLMSERAKIVNEIDPELNNINEQLAFIQDDDPLKDELVEKQAKLIEDKQNVLNKINSIENDIADRKASGGVSANYQAEEMLAQDKSLRDLDYWAYSVPGTMGSSFSDISSYLSGFAGWAIRAGAVALAGTSVVASGGTLLPVIVAGAGNALAAAVSMYGVDRSNRSESLAETYGAYKDRVDKELMNKGTSLQAVADKIKSNLPAEEVNKFTNDQIVDKILTGEIVADDDLLNDAMSTSKSNLDYVYDRNRALVLMDHVQNALTVGVPFGMGSVSKLIGKPIKAALNTTKLGADTLAKGNKLIDDVIGWNTKLALKNPVIKGLTRVPKNLLKYGLSAVGEGVEEGSQNIFNRDFLSGQYDEESSNLLKSYADLLNANYRVAKILTGIDTESELSKDPDFWNEVKGGVALGLLMGGAPVAVDTVYGTAKDIAANRTVRDLTADNLDKKNLMNRIALYSQKATKKFGNYDDEIIGLLEGYKRTQLPDGVTEQDVDNEIELAKSVQISTKDKSVNAMAKAAGFTPGTREYNAFLGLRHLSKVDTKEAADNLLEFRNNYAALYKEYMNDPMFDIYPEEEREAIKQKALSTSLISAITDWIENMESKPTEGKRKYGILNNSNPLSKKLLKILKSNLIAENLKLKIAEGNIKSEVKTTPEPSKKLIDAFIGSLVAESDFNHSSDNSLLLNSEKQFKNMSDEDKQDTAAKIKQKVDKYLSDVDSTENLFEEKAKEEATVDTPAETSTSEEVMPVNEPKVNTTITEPTPQKTVVPEASEETIIPTVGDEETTVTPEVGEEQTQTPEVSVEEEPVTVTEENAEETPTVETEEVTSPTVEEVEPENVPFVSTEDDSIVPTVETVEDKAQPVVDTEELTSSKTDLPKPSEKETSEPKITSENIDQRLKDSEDFWGDVNSLPKATDTTATNDEIDDASKVRFDIERRFDEIDGANPKTPSKALTLRGLNKHDKVSNTMFYSPNSKVPLLPGYESGAELAKLLEIPGVLRKCHLRFFINETFTEKGYKPYVKGDKSTWDGASIMIEIQYEGKKYLMTMLTPNGGLKINSDTRAIQRLTNNRNAIIEAIENLSDDEEVVPSQIFTTNGLYNQNTVVTDGAVKVVHRSVDEIEGLRIPKDPFDINKDTVDIAIGKGMRGEPKFGLFDAEQQVRTGHGGSGQVFYMAHSDQTLSGNELPIQLNLSRFDDNIIDLLYNLIINYVENSSLEIKDVKGKETFVQNNEILHNLVRFGKETFIPLTEESENGDIDPLQFLRDKQLGYSDNGFLFVGSKAYNVTNITPEQQEEIKNHLRGLHWVVNKDTFWGTMKDAFPSVNKHFERTGDTEIEIIPGHKFTKEQFDKNMTVMGWMISNKLLSCDLKDNLFTDAFNYFDGFAVQKKDGSQQKISTSIANGISVSDPVTTTVENPSEQMPEVSTEVIVEEPSSTDTSIEEDELAKQILAELESGKLKGDVLDIYGQDVDPTAYLSDSGIPRILVTSNTPKVKVSEEEIKWFKNKLGLNAENLEFVDQAIALGNDTYAMGLCKLYSTILWKSAEQGTLYHEAFHKVSLLLLSPQERQNIYKLYRNKYKTNAPDSEIEELLAEEFRDYMLNKANVKTNFIRRMFNTIKNFISKWFNISEYGITKLFNRINSGYYSDKTMNSESVNKWLEKFKENSGAPFTYKNIEFKNITNVQLEEIVKTLSSFAIILNKVRYSGEVSKINLDQVKSRLHPKISEYYVKNKTITQEQANIRTEVYNNFDKVFKPLILDEFNRFKIRLSKIKDSIDEETEQKADGQDTADEMAKYTKQSFEISTKNSALPSVKMLIACLPKQDFDPTNPNKLITKVNTLTGLALTVDFDKTWNKFSTKFAKCNEFEEILELSNKLGKQDPVFQTFANTLRGLTSVLPEDTVETKIAKENLKTQVRNTFRKHKADYLFCLIKDVEDENGNISTEIVFKNENANKIVKEILTGWTNLLTQKAELIAISGGAFFANKKQLAALRDAFNNVVKGAQDGRLDSSTMIPVKKWIISTLDMLGINIDTTILNSVLMKYYPNVSEVESLKSFLRDNSDKGIGNFMLYKLKDMEGIEKNGQFKSGKYKITLDRLYTTSPFLQRLAAEYNEVYPNADELSVRTTDDKLFYSITEKNYFFDFVDELNNDEEVLNRVTNVMYNGGNNPGKFIKGSSILNNLNNGKKLKSEVISGFKRDGSNDSGRAYSEISPLEDYVLKMALTRSGRLVLPTMGDSVSYNVLGGDAITMFDNSLDLRSGIAFDSDILDRFCGYFETEIDTIIFNYNNPPTRPQDIIKNYDTGKRWGYKFRYFSQLVDGIDYNSDLAKAEEVDNKNGDKNYTTAKQVISKIKSEWDSKSISDRRALMNSYLMDIFVEELKYADTLGLIKFDGKSLDSVKNVSIPSSFINEVKSRYARYEDQNLINSLAVLDIMMNFIANHQASEIEFTKLFNKDPAYYKSPEDLLKRRREVFSTGITPRTSYTEDPEMDSLKEFTVGTFNDNVIVSRQIDSIMKSASQSYAFDKLQREEGLSYEEAKKALETKDPKYNKIFDEAAALAETRFAGYREVNQTDATVLLSPEGYKQLVRRFIGWQPDVAAAFEVLNTPAIITEDNAELYHKSLNTVLAPLKCMFFGGRFNDELRREVPIFDKMALFPVFPVFATGDMKHVLNRMNDPKNPIHMIAFESAVKVGQDKNANMYNKETGQVDVDAINNIITHKQPLKYFRRQLVTDPHDAEHEQMLVSQALKASLLNVRKDNKYVTPEGNEVTGSQLFEKLFSCMNTLTDRGASEIEQEYGIYTNSDGMEVATAFAVAKSLRRSAESSKMNQNVLDGLEVVNGKPKAPLSGISDNPWMEAALISKRNKKVIDVNTPGGMFIQMSSVAYNDLTVRSDGGVRDLKFDSEDGTVECVVSINLLKTIIPDYDKKSFVESKQWLIDHGVIGRDKAAMAMGYRIPAQGPSSVAALKVVDVYPENIGDTITLPDEWTALTGSDFDVDKLFLARYNYDENGNKVKYDFDNIESNPTQGLQNMMLDLLIASISNRMQFSESKQPLDAVTTYLSKTILGDIDSLKGVSGRKYKQMHYASPSYHNESKSNLMAGKTNLGAFALSNSHHMLAQAVDLSFKRGNVAAKKFGLRTFGKIHSDSPNYHDLHPKNESSKPIEIFTLISDWLSAMVNAHVDVAKDAYINRLNVRKLTINTVNLLLRGGKGESTFYFMAQDILVKYADEYEKYRGFYGVELGGETPENKAYKTVVDEYLKKYNSLRDKSMPELNEAYNVTELTKDEIDKMFDVEYLRSILPKKNTAEWYYTQLKILQAYQELQPAAKALSKSVTLSQIDTKKFGNNFALQQAFLLKLLKFYKEDRMFSDPVSVIQKTFLKQKLIKGLIEPRENFGKLLLRTNPLFEEIRSTIYTMLGSPEYLSDRAVNDITRMMESSFKVSFFTEYAKNNGVNVQGLLYGDNSIPKRLLKIKSEIKAGKYPDLLNSDGTFSNSLLDNIDAILQFTTDDLRLPAFISFKLNKDEDHNLDDHIIRAWEELLESDYEEVRTFARDLVIYSMMTSGDSFGRNNIFRYVPNSFRESCGYFDFIRGLEDDPSKLVNYIDIEMVFRNLWWDDEVVKPISYRREVYDETGVPQTIARGALVTSNEDFVIVEKKGKYTSVPLPILIEVPEAKKVFENDSVPVFTPFVKMSFGGKNNPLTTYVYKFVGARANNKGKIIPVYQVVEKRGMNYKGKTLVDFTKEAPVTRNDELKTAAKLQYQGYTPISSIMPKKNSFGNYLNELLNIIQNANVKPKDKISNATKKYSREEVEDNPRTLYIFTDNTDRTSGGNLYGDSWYKEKYGAGGYGTDKNPTTAIIRGLDNAAPISTMRYFYRSHNNMTKEQAKWQDSDFDEFKSVIDDEIEDIKRLWDSGNYDNIVLPGGDGFYNSSISEITESRTPKLYNYLKSKEAELYNHVTGNIPDELQKYAAQEQEVTEEVKTETAPVIEPKQEITDYKYSFTFADGTVVPTAFELNEQQKAALLSLEEFYNGDGTEFTLKGYAGTGKTTIMKIFDAWLKARSVRPVYVSPTHRANAVTKMNNPSVRAMTLHSLLGLRPDEDIMEAEVDLNKIEFNSDIEKQFNNITFIVDECSMINDSIYDCLVNACKIYGENNKIIFLGDPAQLQPVKSNELSKVFNNVQNESELTKVERTGDNAILEEATRLRNNEELTYKTKLNEKGQGVQYVSNPQKAFEQLRSLVSDERFKTNPLFFKLLTATNNMVPIFNDVIRKIIYGDNPKFLNRGEILMAYSNEGYNYNNADKPYDIVNSVDYKIVSEPVPVVKELPFSNGIKVKGYNVTIQNAFDPDDNTQIFIMGQNDEATVNAIINRIDQMYLAINSAKLSGNKRKIAQLYQEREEFNRSFYTMWPLMRNGKTKKKKTFDYGYAHTIHKSQGGTYDNVMILGSDIEQGFEQNPRLIQQLKYVAVTRAKNKVVYSSNGNPNVVEENTYTQDTVVNELAEGGRRNKEICMNSK